MAKKSYGEYKIVNSHSEGGQSYIYQVTTDKEPEKILILKRLKNIDRIERFIAEIEAIKKLNHPNIIKIIDSDFSFDPPYLVMPYYKKGNLTSLQLDKIEILDKLYVFKQICEGVAFSHSNGIIHRDLKPENILISDDGNFIVSDFGICFIIENGERFTITEEAVGPRYYIAPELEDGRGDHISAKCDVYALGKLLYWLLSGKIFAREKHRELEYDLTKTTVDNSMFHIYEFLDKMIISDLSKRYKDANEIIKVLDKIIAHVKINSHVINIKVPQSCIFCGEGKYQIAITSEKDKDNWVMNLRNFGFQAYTGSNWLILICNKCGNTQIFRLDYTEKPSIWYEEEN